VKIAKEFFNGSEEKNQRIMRGLPLGRGGGVGGVLVQVLPTLGHLHPFGLCIQALFYCLPLYPLNS